MMTTLTCVLDVNIHIARAEELYMFKYYTPLFF